MKRVGLVALGGHIVTQNESFATIIDGLGTDEYEFLGLEDGFAAFNTGNVYPLDDDTYRLYVQREFAGFYAGADRYSLVDKKTKQPDPKKIEKAVDFIKAAKLDYLVGSGGDDHGGQLQILSDALKNAGVECKVLVLNKTMDGDIGGRDGEISATPFVDHTGTTIDRLVGPFTDTSNGYASAVALLSNAILQLYADAWTNSVPLIITHFGREANFVAYGAAYYGCADLVFPGELADGHDGWSLEFIADRIRQAQAENQRRYGRRFAVVVVPEGTKIKGIQHVSEYIKDAHGHQKLQPEILAAMLKERLADDHKLSTHPVAVTYALRSCSQPNSPYSLEVDMELARESARRIVQAIREDRTDLETTIKFTDSGIVVGWALTNLVARKRLTRYSSYPWFNYDQMNVTPEFGRYIEKLLGPRQEREQFLPRKPQVVNVYQQHFVAQPAQP